MKWKSITSKHKVVSVVLAGVLTAGTLFGGTFAWQSLNQEALNQKEGVFNPGGRLHDDFNGSNKDVYVENFSSAADGVPIFARVRLYEYMETGDGAGKDLDSDADRGITVLGKQTATAKDKRSWIVRLPDTNGTAVALDAQGKPTALPDGVSSLRDYWEWSTGGSTTYMPTFNKDRDSLEADINGTLGAKDADDNPYADYVDYSDPANQTKTEDAIYSGNTNVSEEHTAKKTLDTKNVISMAEWKSKPEADLDQYWVYDTDGWVYWSSPIAPETATGLLLDGIKPKNPTDGSWYYAINVVGQFATAGDWGTPASNGNVATGFYKDHLSADGLALLNRIAQRAPVIGSISVRSDDTVYVKPGSSANLRDYISMDIQNTTGNETGILWQYESNDYNAPLDSALRGDSVTPSKDMVGKKYTITATSAFDPTKKTQLHVLVYDEKAVGVVPGADGKMYVNYGDNTFKEILDTEQNGSYIKGSFVSAGDDKKIGNNDDYSNVVVLSPQHPKYGEKFIPVGSGVYRAVGPNKLLGTDGNDGDIRLYYGGTWPPANSELLTETFADGIEITTTAPAYGPEDPNMYVVKPGKQASFVAKVMLKGQAIFNNDVDWTITGGNGKSIIDSNGILTVDSTETTRIGATNLTAPTILEIKATSRADKNQTASVRVIVQPMGWEDLDDVEVGSLQTVTIDGMEWYLLYKNAGEGLIWAKGAQPNHGSGAGLKPGAGIAAATEQANLWVENETTILKDKLLKNPTKTVYRYVSYIATPPTYVFEPEKPVFALSYNDLMGGTWQDARNYTTGEAKRLVTNNQMFQNIVNGTAVSVYTHIRHPAGNKYALHYNTSGAAQYNNSATASLVIRPAMWIKLPSYDANHPSTTPDP